MSGLEGMLSECLNDLFRPSLSIDVDQFLGSIKAILGSLLERYTGAEITNKLGSSILATVFRQLVIHSFLVMFESPSCAVIVELYYIMSSLNMLNECNVCSGPDRWFSSWSCALWTSLTVCC